MRFRKVISVFLVFLVALFVVMPAFAEQENMMNQRNIAFVISLNEYFVNGQAPGVKMDTAVFIKDGRTFVSVKSLGDALGIPGENISRNPGGQKVSLLRSGVSISFAVGVKNIIVNGRARWMDVAPIIRDGVLYVPVRYVTEGFGFQVDWDPVNRIVVCWKGERPDLSDVVKYVRGLRTPKT